MPGVIATANRVNDFVVKFANVNGTGSASANSLVMKAIFRMGVPVTRKNYFPSNIQGLPTWYEIRVTRDGYAARASQVDIMVAMNAETYSRDVREVNSGGYLIYDSTWPRSSPAWPSASATSGWVSCASATAISRSRARTGPGRTAPDARCPPTTSSSPR